ncbi:hypothetical protein F2Q70_00044742 [Brassica cretica]|uniref:Uncharacterized protein n=1 Tax=Brassica cretica TaxID=69181 RepID=A0A8S9KG31_BRACR|nr:hypothetical protein F2Q70_00044742 [Brassica cretica]
MDELEETRGMTGYVRLNPPVTKLEDNNENYVFLLEEAIHVVTCENIAEEEESPATMIDLFEKVPWKIDGDKISYLRSDRRHQLYGIVRSCVKLLFVDKRKTTKPNSPELEFKHELEFAHLIRRLGRILKKLEEWSKQMLKQEQNKQRKRLKLQGLAMLIETMREKTKTTHQHLGCGKFLLLATTIWATVLLGWKKQRVKKQYCLWKGTRFRGELMKGSKAKKDYRKVSQGKSNSLYFLLHTKRGFTIQSSWRMKGYKLVKCFCVLVDELLDGNGGGRQRYDEALLQKLELTTLIGEDTKVRLVRDKILKLLHKYLGKRAKSTVEYGIKFSLGSIELKKLLMEWEKHKAGEKYKKKHTARNKVSFSEKYVVNLVNLMRKQFLTSGKRAKFRQKVMSNGLGCLEMLSPPRMTGKKASSKSLCGFVFLLHILENQIMESASPPGDAEHNGPKAVHGNSNKRSSGHNWCKLKQQGQHKILLSRKRVKLRREPGTEKLCVKRDKCVELFFESLSSTGQKKNTERVCQEKLIEPLYLEMNIEYEMTEKQKLETWSKEVSRMKKIMRKCLDIWKAVCCFNLEDKVDFNGGGNDTYEGMRWHSREQRTWFLSTDQAIETELLERLKKGIYGDIYNYPELEWNKVLDEEKKLAEGVEEEEEEEEPEIEYVEGYEELEEEEDMEDFSGFPSKMSNFNDDEHDSADEEEDDDDGEEQVVIHKKGKRDSRKSDDLGKSKKKKKRVVVEMEQEDGDVIRTLKTAS